MATKASETGWKKGMEVWLVRRGAGKVNREVARVARVTQRGVYLENMPGTDPCGPFEAKSGRRLGHQVGGCTQTIERIAEGALVAKPAEPEADFITV